eukprot:m.131797 g.131797  ORF g.131797 m.131797 type:complete len:859 (+) comp13925_c0_seq2:141-2717(+)
MTERKGSQLEMKASEMHLSSEELLAVLHSVKDGKLTVNQAIDQVKVTEQERSAEPTALPQPTTLQTATPADATAASTGTNPIESPCTQGIAASASGLTATSMQSPHQSQPKDPFAMSNEDQIVLLTSVKEKKLSISQAVALAQTRQPKHAGPAVQSPESESEPTAKHLDRTGAPAVSLQGASVLDGATGGDGLRKSGGVRPISQEALEHLCLQHFLVQAGADLDVSPPPAPLATSQTASVGTLPSSDEVQHPAKPPVEAPESTESTLSDTLLQPAHHCTIQPEQATSSPDESSQLVQQCEIKQAHAHSKAPHGKQQGNQQKLGAVTAGARAVDISVPSDGGKVLKNEEERLQTEETGRVAGDVSTLSSRVGRGNPAPPTAMIQSLSASTSPATSQAPTPTPHLAQLASVLDVYQNMPQLVVPSTGQSSRRRITLCRETRHGAKKLVLLPQPATLNALLTLASETFDCAVVRLTTIAGAEILDMDCIRDDDDIVAESASMRQRSISSQSLASLGSEKSSTPFAQRLHSLSRAQRTRQAVSAAPADGTMQMAPEWIRLNVGGTHFHTTITTLLRDSESMLARMFDPDGDWTLAVDDTGAFLLDRNPNYFAPLLSYLRSGTMVLDEGISPSGVLCEADYFGLADAASLLQPLAEREALRYHPDPPITRAEFTRAILSTSAATMLRCQGLNFTNADLSKLDLRSINFSFAIFDGCDLSKCNLRGCCFVGASMTNCILDGSELMGCNMNRACLTKSSLRNCNFHDPSQHSQASLEGADCQFCDFEDSNLSGVNMRVARLKGAKLRHCNLRGSNMAGTDLGGSDLTGCILQNTNLRGANTLRATFDGITTAIHMSQTVVGPSTL